ncbi:MAG TPA: dihydrodipicolinate reductase C-terminal domain-containing protein [Gemmatimonadaceae bacterium]|nr:dihydrodipicolinate reductase C-terminal domain-containing protein [Gemmatimonadaceae bacterium]
MSRNDPQIAIIGDGKMGRTVAQLVQERGWSVCAMLDSEHNINGRGITKRALGDPDVAIEFTKPDAAVANILACLEAGVPIVVGTTGWFDSLPMVTEQVKVTNGGLLWAPNFAVGVNLFVELTRRAAELMSLAPEFAGALVETHHSAKKDAPSGTALAIVNAMEKGLGKKIPVTSVRTGSVPGTHEVIFDSTYEQMTLRHEARDRRVFADGALRAAHWMIGKQGVFTMRDVLGFTRLERPEKTGGKSAEG